MNTPSAPTKSESYVLPETTALVALGCADLLLTVYLVATNKAREANPLFAPILTHFGPAGFALSKALLLAVPVVLLEWTRRRRPRLARTALRWALVLYASALLLAYAPPLLRRLVPLPAPPAPTQWY